ncbi:hypothetical protein QAD02_018474 [Eretmocerus hayati]|uniref:Uncharacterized protein n=1 Tax=Eretmocerus hayati TaxID=131215 RepID=A0ACC2PGT1_9HYME|nr:hypothetical protein QAD02_018474 [Eretmocerus hayati]
MMCRSVSFCYQNTPDFDKKKYQELREAIRKKNIDLVQNLVEHGANVNGVHQDSVECTPLHLAVISRCPKIVEILLKGGADMSIRCGMWGDTPLTFAARIENTSIVDLLLS